MKSSHIAGTLSLLWVAACAVEPGATDSVSGSQPAAEENVAAADEPLTSFVTRRWACADAGYTIWFANARAPGAEVGGSVTNDCRDPQGCITHYHICGPSGCGPEQYFGWDPSQGCGNW